MTSLLKNEDKKYTFQELQAISAEMFQSGTLPPQMRTPAMLADLASHYSFLNANFWSSKDYILFKVFGSECYDHVDGGVVKKKARGVAGDAIHIVKNDFPYDKLINVEHWLLWSNKPMPRDEAKTIIDNRIMQTYNTQHEYIFYVNPTAIQSIPELFHYQIFVHVPKQ